MWEGRDEGREVEGEEDFGKEGKRRRMVILTLNKRG